MIRTYCDICGKELKEDCSDQVNIDFHSFGISGFILKLEAHQCKANEINLCVDCARGVVSDIEKRRKLRTMRENKSK